MKVLFKIENLSKRIGLTFIALFLILFINISSFEIATKNIYVWEETEDADEIIEGLAIKSDESASGKKGIISNIASHNVRAYAKYNLQITQPGEYRLWARCKWDGACSNSFLVQMDKGQRNKFGSEPIYKKWIWSKGLTYNLSKGDHIFFIWNEEFNSEMDKFLFTTDFSNKPTGLGQFNSFDIDFESGRNFTVYIKNHSKNWKIVDPDEPIKKLLFKKEDILNPELIAQKITERKDFSNRDICVFLPLNLKMKIDNGNFKEVTSKEISNLFNTIILSDDFLGTGYDHELSAFKLETKRIKYRRNIVIFNFRNQLAPLGTNRYNRSLYMIPSENQITDYIKIDSKSPKNYIIHFNYMFGDSNIEEKNLSVLFNQQDERNYYHFEIKDDKAYLSKQQNGKINEIGISKIKNLPKQTSFNALTIIRDFPNIIIKHNHNTILYSTDSSFSSGNMAIGSKFGDVYIDNIQQEASIDINYQQNFFGHSFFETGKYLIHSGFWYQTGENERYLFGKKNSTHDAKISFGYGYWKNYLTQCAINLKNGTSVGILFNIQNPDNYYQFRWLQNKNNSAVLQLVKVTNNVIEILDEKIMSYESYLWHKIVIKSFNGNLSVLIHDNIVLEARDSSFKDGYVGFWTNSNEEIAIDDIYVHSINSLQETEQNETIYQFSDRSSISMDLCDWIPVGNMSYKDYFGINELTNKKLLENVCLLNRKKIIGESKVGFSFYHEKCYYQYSPLKEIGINPFLRFDCYNGKNKDTYIFKIEKDAAVLYMNEKEIEKVNINTDSSSSMSAQYQDNTWSFVYNRNDTLYFKPTNKFNYYYAGFGYDGTGVLNRIHSRLRIENNNFAKE